MVVLDKHGKPVKNLKAADVQVLEDNVPQQITSFRFVPPAEAQAQPARTSAPATAVGTAAPQPGSRPLHTVNLICLVFHNLDPVARSRAIDVVREFLKNDLPRDTYIGIFVLDDRLNPVYPFTNNKQELAGAVGNAFMLRPLDFVRASEAALTANPTQVSINTVVNNATHTASTTFQVTGGEVSPTVVTGAEVSTDIGANAVRGNQVTESRDFSHITGMRETDRIINMVTQFGRLPGRKTVLLLSTGLPTTGDPDRFQSMVAKANASDVTVYAIDASGLTETSSAQAGKLALGQVAGVSRSQTAISRAGNGVDNTMGALGAAKEKSRQGDTMNDAVRNSDMQASLRALAEDTGGFLIANTNEFRKPFQRIVDDMETHYELTYRPTSSKYDGRLRLIQIKLSHPDWKAESRTGYFAVPDLSEFATLLPHEIIGLAVLDSKPLPHAFDLHAAVFNFHSDGQNRQSALVIEVPGQALTATPSPGGGGTHVLRNQILAVIKDAGGQIVDKFSLDAPYEIADSKLAELRVTPLVYTHPLDLPLGSYTAEIVAMDREGGRAGSSVLPFDTSNAEPGIGMSSALLIRRIEPGASAARATDPLTFKGQRLVPFVETALAPETKPYAYFVVYPNSTNRAKPKVRVEFRVGGELLADQTTDLPAPDAAGAIPMVIRAAVHTGQCELKITSIQGDESVTRTLTYAVAAK